MSQQYPPGTQGKYNPPNMSNFYLTPTCPHCINLNRNRPPDLHLPTDHYLRETRDRTSPIACPMLKQIECPLCGLKGHTRSHCKTGKFSITESPPPNQAKVNIITNRFASLFCDDSSSEDEVEYSNVVFEGPFRPKSPDYPPPDY